MGGNRPTYDVDGYSRGNANIDETERFSTTESPSPWYLKRWVLALWGLTVVILIAIIIYGLAILARGGGRCTNAGHDALVDHDVLAHHQPVADPVVDHSDHDGHLDRDHRSRAAAGHREPGRRNILGTIGGEAICPRYRPYRTSEPVILCLHTQRTSRLTAAKLGHPSSRWPLRRCHYEQAYTA